MNIELIEENVIYTDNVLNQKTILDLNMELIASDNTYRLVRFISEGIMAKVYECFDQNGKKFALKHINKYHIIEKKSVQDIQNEINIHISLSHENIVSLYKIYQTDNDIFMIMELCSTNLYDFLHNQENLEEINCKHILKQIVNAMIYLHEKFIIHNDIKLENILIDFNGNIKISDFGYSVQLNSLDDTRNRNVGTVDYLSPEKLNKEDYSFQSDVWAIGVLYYELLFEKPPFWKECILDTYRAIRSVNFKIPETRELSFQSLSIINGTLRKEPLSRISLNEIYLLSN